MLTTRPPIIKKFFPISIPGTFAVISILVSKPVIEHCTGEPTGNATSLEASLNLTSFVETSSDDFVDCEIKVTVAVTFLAGLMQVPNKALQVNHFSC